MNVLEFTENGFLFTTGYIEYCYKELTKSKQLRADFTIENFTDIVATNYKVVDNMLSFIDYLNNEMESF